MRLALAASLVAALQLRSATTASVYATGLDHPTALSFGPTSGCTSRKTSGSRVGDARHERPRPFLRKLLVPLGLLWRGRTLYVSESGRVEAFGTGGRRLRVVLSHLPYKLHQQDAIVAGPDGRLYLGSGSTCDACVEQDPRSAAILSFRPDGTGLRIVARGLRNPYGLLFVGKHAVRDRQRARQARRRRAGRERRARAAGRELRLARLLAELRAEAADRRVHRRHAAGRLLEPHSSADGIASWRGDLFVAEWGEYLSDKHGRRVVEIRAAGYHVRNRFRPPLALAVDPAGDLLVADWGRGVIYAIRKS